MTTDNPWKNLAPPDVADALNARRVDANNPWNFFWARGVDRRCLLILHHRRDSTPTGRLPQLKGIEISVSEGEGDSGYMLAFRLVDPSLRDIFFRLCQDIVVRAATAASESEAVEVALNRTWRWHHLLRGGRDGRLSSEEQKALIGELFVLEHILLACLSSRDAVSAWRGPLDAPKDFEIGRVSIEAKARRGAATPFVAISSEHQLDASGVDALFLHVLELDQAPTDEEQGYTVSTSATRIRDRLLPSEGGVADAYEALLMATGFRWEDDYSDSRWIEGKSRIYIVTSEFPRITPERLIPGVSYVRYSVALADCEPFLVADTVLRDALKGDKNAT